MQYPDAVAELAVGSYGQFGPAGWTTRFDSFSHHKFDVSEDAAAPSGKSIKIQKTFSDRMLFSYNAVNADSGRATSEVIALCRMNQNPSATANFGGIAARGNGDGNAESAVTAIFGGNGSSGILKSIVYTGGASSTVNATPNGVWTNGAIRWLKLVCSGDSATLYMYAENDLNGTPLSTQTRTGLPSGADNWIGLYGFASDLNIDYLYFSVGTGGDSAPVPGGEPDTGVSSDVAASIPLFGASANHESTVPQYSSDIDFGVPFFSAAIIQSADAVQNISDVSFGVSLFSASISQDSQAPVYESSASLGVPFFAVSVQHEQVAPNSGTTASFSVPMFGASASQESSLPEFNSSVSFGVSLFSASVQQIAKLPSADNSVSISVPLFGVGAEQVSTVPTYNKTVSFSVPLFGVSILAGEFEYFTTPSARIDLPNLSRKIDVPLASRSIDVLHQMRRIDI